MKSLHPVYQLVQKIPKGKVSTYGAIGKVLGLNPRHVGRILHRNEDGSKVPCHRVVKSDGSIASGYAFGGPGKQQMMLKKEGVLFRDQKIEKNNILRTL